jgi:VCBS repeat protein
MSTQLSSATNFTSDEGKCDESERACTARFRKPAATQFFGLCGKNCPSKLAPFIGDTMQRSFLIRPLAIVACGAALGLAAPFGNTSSPGPNNTADGSPAFQAGAATHETRIESQTAPEFPSATEMPAQGEIEIPAPTRSTFMASWPSVKGTLGYLLDISTSDSFSSYVDGYHDLDVGNVTARVVTGLNRGTTYYHRVRAYGAAGPGDYSGVTRTTTEATTGLNINPTFDSSITGNPNAAAIEAMINRAISFHELLFNDPITIQIRFRYSATGPDGTPLPAGAIAQSLFVIYQIPWSIYIDALRADARTSNDNLANASLPGTALSPNIKPRSAGGRAVGLNTPTAMFANGTVGQGGPYDGIVTLKSSVPYQFTRPTSAGNLDAQRSTEHEVDEVIALGSRLGHNGNDLDPQDLFSWSSPGVRNITSSGTRYFSINGGVTNIVNFNQNPNGDFGDWLSEACPQAHPYVQNAFACTGQSSDIAATSPEGTNLDVVGYDLVNAPVGAGAARAAVSDFNHDSHPDYVLQNGGTRQTALWYLNNNVYLSGAYGPTLAVGWALKGVADFNRDSHSDYALFALSTHKTALWYLSGPTFIGSAYGPTLQSGWELVATADFNGDNNPDYVLYKSATRQTALWYLNNNVRIGSAWGPTLPPGWSLMGVADFNRDGHTDYALFNSSTRQTALWYLSGPTRIGSAYGPNVPGGWALVATADFNGDGNPDYLLYSANTRQTAIWYLSNNVYVSGAFGPTLPAGWSLVGQ